MYPLTTMMKMIISLDSKEELSVKMTVHLSLSILNSGLARLVVAASPMENSPRIAISMKIMNVLTVGRRL
jgi:hypothetical protein